MYLKNELFGLIKTDESIFNFIQENALDGLWYWDLENPENEWMNAKFWTVLGYNPDEMPHKSTAWQNIVNQDDLKCASDNFTKHCESSNHPYDQVVRYTHKNGSTVWIRCRGKAIRDSTGKPIRMLGAHQDLTELKSREQELYKANEKIQESEKKLRKSIEFSPIPIAVAKDNGDLLFLNKQFVETYGYSIEEMPSMQKWFELAYPDIEYRNSRLTQSSSDAEFAIKNNVPTTARECFVTCKNGDVKTVEISKFIEKDITIELFQDITERKQAEEKEKELLKKFELISLHLPGVIYQFRLRPDGSFHFPYASPGIYMIYGIQPKDVEHDATNAFKAIHPDDLEQVSLSINHSAQTLTPWHDIYRVNQPSGKTIWVEGNSTPQKLEDESIIWHGYIQDITKRKNAKLTLLTKMAELERFHKLTVGREINMVALKKEVNNLLKKLGEDPKYKIVE